MDWSQRGHVLATYDDDVVYCRVVGLGNMNNCAPFQAFSVQLQKQGYREFVLDFSRCEGLDSTFLGILLGIALGSKGRRSNVVVVNASDSICRILSEVGIDRLLQVHKEPTELPKIPLQRLDSLVGGTGGKQRECDRIRMILEAHENLCRIAGANNQDRFGSFLTVLRTELAACDEAENGSSIPPSDNSSQATDSQQPKPEKRSSDV